MMQTINKIVLPGKYLDLSTSVFKKAENGTVLKPIVTNCDKTPKFKY